MRYWISLVFIALCFAAPAQSQRAEALQSLPFGSIKPEGWLKAQMQADLEGFVGHLDQIVPELISDPIYGAGRLQKNSKAKDLGNLKEGDAAGDEQYKWWNSETQSNWWDGYLRHALLLEDEKGMEKVRKYVENILATQDADGYIGIYDKDLRYNFNSENGELWSKASLYRGLLGYYEFTKDEKVFLAVQRAVDNVMANYPIHASSPFSSGESFNGGVSHGLVFTDVLERMFFHTKDQGYREYALFLYRDFSKTYQSESDAQLPNILDAGYKLKSHGVHTFEHIRPLVVAAHAAQSPELDEALRIYLARIQHLLTPSGGAIGDEWIAERQADATHTGYEYCSLQELLDSYCLLLQKTGDARLGDAVEHIFYNAAQGARHPSHSCIAYLKTDNSFEMLGTRNGEVEHDRKQTRYKYSAAHQDVAVCCNPNAGRIGPYFLQNAWMRENDSTLVATLLVPSTLETQIGPSRIRVENRTDYPYGHRFQFKIQLDKATRLTFKIRKPQWATGLRSTEAYRIEGDFIVIERMFGTKDKIAFSFAAEVQIKSTPQGERYFTHGALLYAKPIAAEERPGKVYAERFPDFTYAPIALAKYAFAEQAETRYRKGRIHTQLIHPATGKAEKVRLVPLGQTVLRQSTF